MKDVSARLESLEQFGWRFGLESITALLEVLGNPHLSLRCVHVAGSNGKGSTCAYMASLLKHSGYKTGLYTSPHLSDIRERFRINGVWISAPDFNRHGKRILAACQKVKKRLGHSPTHFEALTAMAFSWFKEKKVDWVVLEVGLGGRLDATNVISLPALSLITPVGLEHQNILGKTLKKIAGEKAGILKRGCPSATLQVESEALREIVKKAKDKGSPLWVGGRDFKFKKEPRGFRWEGPGLSKSFRIPDLSDYQADNASLALAGLQQLRSGGVFINEASIPKALSKTRWPGRLESIRLNPLIVLDGAHNPAAAQALVSSLEMKFPGKRWMVLNGFLKDKDYQRFAEILKPITKLSIVTEPPSGRKENAARVFTGWEKNGIPSVLVKDWRKALGLALDKLEKKDPEFSLLITGSFYLGGACRRELVGLKELREI